MVLSGNSLEHLLVSLAAYAARRSEHENRLRHHYLLSSWTARKWRDGH